MQNTKLTSITSCFVLLVALFAITFNTQAQTTGPTEGSLNALDEKGKPVGLCPLKHTEVKAEISGFITRVTVTQEFVNPFDRKIEAVYTFPLSQNAAVDDMTMFIGERVVRGKIMKREEAAEVYKQAKERGQVASLLEQQRPNIFIQYVANITPEAQVKVVISYVEVLKYGSGSYEFVFPMTIGERYIPSNVLDRDKISPSSKERPGHTISLEVKIDAGVPIVEVSSVTHQIEANAIDYRQTVVRLIDQETIPNKDFVLRYKTAGEKIEDALLTHRSDKGGFFTLILQPPDRITVQDVTPKEIVFVLDTSGSMSGFPIEKAKECMKLALDSLYPNDTFNLITFAGDTHILFDEPVPATKENLERAQEFLTSREGNGGTEMMKAIKAALEPSDSQGHIRIACFMTDGIVGNDTEIISEVKKHPNTRVFAFGIGSSVNRFLLDGIAKAGRGEVEYVTLNDDGSAAAKRFHERIRNPLLTDVSIDWNGLPVADVYPQRIQDLFSAKPIVVTGRFTRAAKGTIRLRGNISGRFIEREIPVEFPESENTNDSIATLWARMRVADLMGQDYNGAQQGNMKKELRDAVTQLGLEFRLLTQFTSFVAVEEIITTEEGEPKRVEAPVAAPENTSGSVSQPLSLALGYSGGSMSQTVTVTSSSSSVSTTAAHVSSVAQANTLQDAAKGNNLYSLISLSPGIVSSGPGQTSSTTFDATLFSSNGQRQTSNYFYLDGLSANIGLTTSPTTIPMNAGATPSLTATGGTNSIASIDGVDELRITSYSPNVDQSRASGAQIGISTKAGTNTFHGSLFEIFGNGRLDANDWFANSRNLQRPARQLNNFGGSLGGPVRKDNNFFFTTYEGLRLRQPAFALTDVPSLSARADASQSVQNLLRAFPLPNGVTRNDGFAELSTNFVNPASLNAASLRLDSKFSDNVDADVRYGIASSDALTRGEDGFSLNTLKRADNTTQTLNGLVTVILSPITITEFRVNFSRVTLGQEYSIDSFGGADLTGAQALFNAGPTFSKYDLFGKNAALASGQKIEGRLRQFHFINNWSTVRNNHAFAFGLDYRRLWIVTGAQTTERNVLFSGASGAFTGNTERVSFFSRIGPQRPRITNLSLYAQDEWKISPRINLTFGLLWQVNPPPSTNENEKPLALSDWRQPFAINIAPSGSSLWRTTYNNFAPRAGLAWDIAGNGKSVLRAGFGVYHDLGNTDAVQVFSNSSPFVRNTVLYNQPLSSLPVSPSHWANKVFIGYDPKLKLPYALRWNIGYEREIYRKIFFSANYVGSKGQRLLLTRTLADQNPVFDFARITTNEAESDYNALQFQFRTINSKSFTTFVSYTFSKSLDNYSSDLPDSALIISNNPREDRGVSDFDVRHNFNGVIAYTTPTQFANKHASLLLRSWTFSSLFNLRTSLPLNVVYGRVNSFGISYFRPDLIQGVPLYSSDGSVGGRQKINPSAFSIPTEERQGNLGRNSLRGFPLYQLDLAASREFNLKNEMSLTFKLTAINVFNHPNFAAPIGADSSIGSSFPSGVFVAQPYFGRTSSLLGSGSGTSFYSLYQQGGARSLQLSFKLRF